MNYVLCETFRVASGSSSRINMVNLAYPRKRLLLIVYFYQMYKYLSQFLFVYLTWQDSLVCLIFLLTHAWTKWNNRVRTESWILVQVLKFAHQFSRLEKVVRKNGKKFWVFLYSKLQQVLYKWNIFLFGQILFNLAQVTFASHHEKSFVPTFFKVSIGKRLELWIQKSVQTLE